MSSRNLLQPRSWWAHCSDLSYHVISLFGCLLWAHSNQIVTQLVLTCVAPERSEAEQSSRAGAALAARWSLRAVICPFPAVMCTWPCPTLNSTGKSSLGRARQNQIYFPPSSAWNKPASSFKCSFRKELIRRIQCYTLFFHGANLSLRHIWRGKLKWKHWRPA